MCTLVAAFHPDARYPLVVAANRDERLQRPSTPPHLWADPLPFLAPRDEQAGGTWLGLNRHNLFVGVTNRFGVTPEPQRTSRGQLVLSALRSPDAASLHHTLHTLEPDRYNAFHLLYADPTQAFVTWSDGARIHQQTLEPGLHIITERSLGGDDHARTELILRHAEPLQRPAPAPPPSPEELQHLLGQHGPDPFGSTCVHLPAFEYGTRSSMMLWMGKTLHDTRLSWAEGPPCTTPFVPQTELLARLRDP